MMIRICLCWTIITRYSSGYIIPFLVNPAVALLPVLFPFLASDQPR